MISNWEKQQSVTKNKWPTLRIEPSLPYINVEAAGKLFFNYSSTLILGERGDLTYCRLSFWPLISSRIIVEKCFLNLTIKTLCDKVFQPLVLLNSKPFTFFPRHIAAFIVE